MLSKTNAVIPKLGKKKKRNELVLFKNLAELKRNKLGDTVTGKRRELRSPANIEHETNGINPDFLLMNLKRTNLTIIV